MHHHDATRPSPCWSAPSAAKAAVLTEWLVDVRARGYAAQARSIPGVAQRTGDHLLRRGVPGARWPAGGRRPVFSLSPVPGTLDAIVSSELLETARQIGRRHERTAAHAGHHLLRAR
jgi:hypothetical protein